MSVRPPIFSITQPSTSVDSPVGVNAHAPQAQPPSTVDRVDTPPGSIAPRVTVRQAGGLPRGFDANVYGNKNFASAAGDAMSGLTIARPKGTNFMGYGDVTNVRPTQDGFAFDVNVYTRNPEKVCLVLQVPLLEKGKGHLTYVNLDVLTHDGQGNFTEAIPSAEVTDPITGKEGVWAGRRSYAFSLAQINAYLNSYALGVEVKPGDMLSVSGLTEESGHRVMNAVSNAFMVPRPLVDATATLSPTATRTTKARTHVVTSESLPLDIAVKLPSCLLGEKVSFGGRRLIVGHVIEGDITTRLESEYKGAVTESQMNAMVDRAYALAELSERAERGDKKARKVLDGVLGKGMVLTPVKRHWLAEDGLPVGNRNPDELTIMRDEHGRPCLDPMLDDYSDDPDLRFSQLSGAVRVRGNAQKSGHAEFKLTGGRLDPATGIRQRVETGITLKPDATEQDLADLLAAVREDLDGRLGTSPLGHLVREARKVGLDKALTTNRTLWAHVEQIRHKFELKNTLTGTSAELSLDTVHARTVRPEHNVDGKPQERTFYVMETELDHLQINSANVTEMKDPRSRAALLTLSDQLVWMTAAKVMVANGKKSFEVMNQPQLHSLDHVEEGSFRQTRSYKEFEVMQEKLLTGLCEGFRPDSARQKSAHFAQLLGLIGPEGSPLITR